LPCSFILSLISFILFLHHLFALQLHFVTYQFHLIPASSFCLTASFCHFFCLAASFCHLSVSSYSCIIFLPCSFILSLISFILFLHHLFALQLHFVTYQFYVVVPSCFLEASFHKLAASSYCCLTFLPCSFILSPRSLVFFPPSNFSLLLLHLSSCSFISSPSSFILSPSSLVFLPSSSILFRFILSLCSLISSFSSFNSRLLHPTP